MAEADPFDLLLPLWSIVLISVLTNHEVNASICHGETIPPAKGSLARIDREQSSAGRAVS
jgi:hypothetical protein